MALVVFRSKASGEIFYLAENARRLFDIIGKAPGERGVITAAQLPDAIAKLTAAIDEEKAQLKAAAQNEDADERGGAQRAVTLGQRAYPLLEMLRAANKKSVDVTWGI
ncbi:MAG: DUF1840 domain-containing protein [Gemmatimonadota bacterium]